MLLYQHHVTTFEVHISCWVIKQLMYLYLLVLVVDERGSFSAVDAHIFPSFIKTVLEDVD